MYFLNLICLLAHVLIGRFCKDQGVCASKIGVRIPAPSAEVWSVTSPLCITTHCLIQNWVRLSSAHPPLLWVQCPGRPFVSWVYRPVWWLLSCIRHPSNLPASPRRSYRISGWLRVNSASMAISLVLSLLSNKGPGGILLSVRLLQV